MISAEIVGAPLYKMLRGKIGFGWKYLFNDISFSDIKIIYFLGRYAIMVCNFYIYRDVFPCLAFLPFCMQMVNRFSVCGIHSSKPKFIQVISDFKLLFNFRQT